MAKMGILMPLDHSKIPNLKNLDPKFADPVYDPANTYSVAYQWGTTGLIYNKTKFTKPVDSWGALLDPEPGIRFSMYGAEREMIGFLLAYNGYSLNETSKGALKQAVDCALAAKKNAGFSGFVANVAGANQVKAGVVDISICNSADSTLAMEDNEDLAFAIPKEGTVLWCDNLAIPAKAPNPELAHQFLNFILDAQIGADISNYLWFGSPNKASFQLLNEEMTKDPNLYPDEETMKKLEIIDDSTANSGLYGEVWKMIKTR
jgi:spermidine/putrescine transport system substrate-binding protein